MRALMAEHNQENVLGIFVFVKQSYLLCLFILRNDFFCVWQIC